MRRENGITLIAITLIIVTLAAVMLAAYIVYDKVINKNQVNTEISTKTGETEQKTEIITPKKESKAIKMSDVAGKYTAEYVYDEEEAGVQFDLWLYSNGRFKYSAGIIEAWGTIGNYYIEGNRIILTYWFYTASDAEMALTRGSKSLIINQDGSITDNNLASYITSKGIKSVNMKKTEEQVKDMIDKWLEDAIINGGGMKSDKVYEPNI